MHTVVGSFPSHQAAAASLARLQEAGVAGAQVHVLDAAHPGAAPRAPRSEVDYPAAGRAIWAITGGGAGALLGLLVAAFMLPEVGLLSAVGLTAIATAVSVGAVAGALFGLAVEAKLEQVPPANGTIRDGRTVVVVEPHDTVQSDVVRRLFKHEGADVSETISEQWLGVLRQSADSEQSAGGGADNETFRRGFEVAQLSDVRNQTYAEAQAFLRAHYPHDCQDDSFRRGFDRGVQHRWAVDNAWQRRAGDASELTRRGEKP